MTIHYYSGTKLIRQNNLATLLTDKEVTERMISYQSEYPNDFIFIKIKGSNVPTVLYTYDRKLEKLIKSVVKPNRLPRLYGNALNK